MTPSKLNEHFTAIFEEIGYQLESLNDLRGKVSDETWERAAELHPACYVLMDAEYEWEKARRSIKIPAST